MERKEWADVAKAFAIIAVIIGHTSEIPDILSRIIFSFHMPLFFILSGYFTKDCANLRKATSKDAKNLLLPYAVTCGMTIVLAAIRALILGQDVVKEIIAWSCASLYGSGTLIADWAAGTRIIGAIWFLLALFFARFFMNYTSKFGKNQGLVVAIIAYIGWKTTSFTWLPLSVQAGMTATLFLYIGQRIRLHDMFQKSYEKKDYLTYILAGMVWLFCMKYGGRLYMVGNRYSNGLLDIIGSVCATFCLVWISMLIEKFAGKIRKLLSYVGRITLPILCMHILELNLFPWDLFYKIIGIEYHWILGVIFRIALIGIMCLVLYWMPWIGNIYFGKQKNSKTSR